MSIGSPVSEMVKSSKTFATHLLWRLFCCDCFDHDREDEEVTPKKSEDEKATPKKQVNDVKVVDDEHKSNVKQPKTPTTGKKTLFAANLSFEVEKSDVENFFKEAGEIVDVRFTTNQDGSLRGFGHIDFASAEVAQKGSYYLALKLHGKEFLGRAIWLELSIGKSFNTPGSNNSSRNNHSFNGKESQCQTIFVTGINSPLREDKIKSDLIDHFSTCGEVGRIFVPTDHETGAVRGFAFVELKDGYKKALEQSGSKIGGRMIAVEAVKPRRDGDEGGRSSTGRDNGVVETIEENVLEEYPTTRNQV